MQQDTKSLRLIPTKFPSVFLVVLFLPSGKRIIGRLDKAAGGIFYTKRTDAHLHRLSNGLGINYELLTNFSFRWIYIEYEGRKLVTTREYFLKSGKVLNYTHAGFELQVFLPLDGFGRERALESERRLPTQRGLFDATQMEVHL